MAEENESKSAFVQRGEALLDEVAQRSTATTRHRLRQLLRVAIPILQSAVAAAVAWFIADDVLGHSDPFFAPIAAVISLGVSLGQRLRRSIEIVLGVAVGVLAADVLAMFIGRGTAQIALFVALAMAVAVLAGGGPLVVNQGAASAILIATLAPAGDPSVFAVTRFIDALIGGVVGLVVNAVLLPVNPIVIARRAGDRILDELVGTLEDVATALDTQDRDVASAALRRAAKADDSLVEFEEELSAGREITRLSPARWRMHGHLTQYVEAVPDIANAVRNVRVLARRSAALTRVGEQIDPQVTAAIRRLAEAVRVLGNELAKGVQPRAARIGLADTAALLATQSARELDFSASVVVAQLRSAMYDLLLATGLGRSMADQLLEEADKRGRAENG